MVETDWKELLSFSQKELKQADKEKLCECLSWMEADDIEINFTDLKILFRLSQDILKYKTEQVNNLQGQLETQRKSGKGKKKDTFVASPSRSTDSVIEIMAHQEEEIKANKEVLKQLYQDIAELEARKGKLTDTRNLDNDTDSSRDALSEMNAVAQLENEVTMKNRHIRKLLSDVKVLEEDNSKLKEKLSVLKDKLTEATLVIENLTDQVLGINDECTKLKENLGKSKENNIHLSMEVDSLKKELADIELNKKSLLADIKSKATHWKNMARTKRAEVETLENENTKLKEELIRTPKMQTSPKRPYPEELKLKELQEKLSEASSEMLQSAKLIELLKQENEQLKQSLEDTAEYSTAEVKNESDDGKERIIIGKLRKKVKNLTVALAEAEEMITIREQELSEIITQLKLVQKDEGVKALFEGLKHKKQQLKLKNQGIKTLVQEVNHLNQLVDDLQLQNETMRAKLNIPQNELINTSGIIKKYKEIETKNKELAKKLSINENKLISLELGNRSLFTKLTKMTNLLVNTGFNEAQIDEICGVVMPTDGGGESSQYLVSRASKDAQKSSVSTHEEEMRAITEENEGLRKGLQEILNFLKDYNSSSSGVLALHCPSLEAVLQSMEARHAAGWFAPHMAAVMELKAALGGKDALQTALQEARKETFDVMDKLSKESKKSMELEKKLCELEVNCKEKKEKETVVPMSTNLGEFGSWVADKEEINLDVNEKSQIDKYVANRNMLYEDQLKSGLTYFYNKLNILFDTMTSLTIQTADDKNRWRIQEENYKAEIENLKSQVENNVDDDISEQSPGLIIFPNASALQRKCSYLEESYRYIRTLNEDIQAEHLDTKRDAMMAATQYEAEIHKLILTMHDLTDKLRKSISLELFWKQNETLSDILIKYRNALNNEIKSQIGADELNKRLEENKVEVLSEMQRKIGNSPSEQRSTSSAEIKIMQKQLQDVCDALNEKEKQIEELQKNNMELQDSQTKIINKSISALTNKDIDFLNKQLKKVEEENKVLMEQCKHTDSQLNIALIQLQDGQQKQLNNDMEINLLRHQILDLQSSGDNKAIVARLGGEVLVAHLQASESQKKIERLNLALNKEKQLRAEAEEMLLTRQNIFDFYAYRYEAKFRYMYEVLQVLRQQYHGCIPLTSIENYTNNIEELWRKTYAVNEKLNDIEDLQTSLITKHSVFERILDVSRNKCLEEEDGCPHKLKLLVSQGIYNREVDYLKTKMESLDQARADVIKRCNNLEKTLILVNQGFEKTTLDDIVETTKYKGNDIVTNIEIEDVQSDDDTNSRRSQTITLPKPLLLKPSKINVDMTKTRKDDNAEILPGSPQKIKQKEDKVKTANVLIQTNFDENDKMYKTIQTDVDEEVMRLKNTVKNLKMDAEKMNTELLKALNLADQRASDAKSLKLEKNVLDDKNKKLGEHNKQKDKIIDELNSVINELRNQFDQTNLKINEYQEIRDTAIRQENNSLLISLKKLETDKNAIIEEYKELVSKEREEYAKSVKDLQVNILELKSQLDRRGSESDISYTEKLQEVVTKYTQKLLEMEDECFTLRSKLDSSKTELSSYQNEIDRWKNLASERLIKMEQLNSQLEERHSHEVESYKAENQHWLTQLSDTQREHLELRSKLSEQKAFHVKEMSDKEVQIEQLRSVIHSLKSQIMNMQTMMSVTDPSFDLSAIVEVEESSDALSHHGSERLELKFDSALDLHDMQDDARMPATSTAIWQEPIIERLRREKQLISKQNGMLRRQVKALAARERRARLDAHNLKNQVFRITTSGNRVMTAETASLHNKIATLQAQLVSARRDTHSSVALWDKWKRAQQSSDRWQARFEEKCQDVKKLEASLNLTKSALSRLEKEKRVLLSRLSDVKMEHKCTLEKQDGERSEKSARERDSEASEECGPPVSARALLDRVQAQQRRIAALEVAEKGNEVLVSEYEKSLAEITSLKGQVLKLESTLLESQIRTPLHNTQDTQPELEYWKSYCEMLKEENVQLNLRAATAEGAPVASHHRVHDLEQTVLTLRGLVSKLQAEQKSSGGRQSYSSSRPGSAHSASERNRAQLESYRVEIANLKRSIQDKDLLLEKSKEMLKIAAEREDDLLRENAFLRRRLDELSKPAGGFLSA